MSVEFRRAYELVKNWVDAATEKGWLAESDRSSRPLVVGLFGGTGVGKSSLLNRLAGEAIAAVGVQRPTSREVTLYLHESHALASLPAEFPVQATRVAHHKDSAKQDVVWIDMPDIDSTETSNRKLVFAWLPYIDWVIYVVTPERYRDDAGWQIVRQRGHRHRWLFVMNHWDVGAREQVDEFVGDLEQAGFDSPTVFTSSCVDDSTADEFERIEQTIREAIDSHGLSELKRLGIWARLRDLEKLRAVYRTRLGDDETWRRFVGTHRDHAQRILSKLGKSAQWTIETIAQGFRNSERGWFTQTQPPPPQPIDLRKLRTQLWPSQAQDHIDDIVNQAFIDAELHGVAADAVQRSISSSLTPAADTLVEAAAAGLERALAKPGTPVARGCRALARWGTYLLPLAATAWAAYHVVTRYQQALAGGKFLGTDFATHSLLLIFLAWLAPFVLFRLLKPSLPASARRGLKAGVDEAIGILTQKLDQAYAQLARERSSLLDSLDKTEP